MKEDNRTIVPILIANYNGRSYLEDCLRSLHACVHDRIGLVVYIVDNASQDDSVSYVRAAWPGVRIIQAHANLGFAGGNNLGWSVIRSEWPGVKYIFLLNQDTVVAKNFLVPLVRYLDNNPAVGAVQPKITLYPETSVINTLGNVIHFLGFGYGSGSGQKDTVTDSKPSRINYASGAAVLLRVASIDTVGLFDDFMFMYLEDLDLGWRLSLSGSRSMLIPESVIHHKYEFTRGMRQYYYFERNRIWILLKNYRIRTLLLIVPAIVVMELAQMIRAVSLGILKQKLRGYLYFFNVAHLRKLAQDRKRVQAFRIVSDRVLFSSFTGRIDFQPLHIFLIDWIANPIFNTYWLLIKSVVRW